MTRDEFANVLEDGKKLAQKAIDDLSDPALNTPYTGLVAQLRCSLAAASIKRVVKLVDELLEVIRADIEAEDEADNAFARDCFDGEGF